MYKELKSKEYVNFSTINFSSLKFWDYDTLKNKTSIKSNYQLIDLSKVLKLRKDFIIIDNYSKYKRCRVQLYGRGIVLRDVVEGSEIKTKKQFPCKTGDLLVAEIDAKLGGFGIVPPELEGAIVSSHYFLFEIDETKILREYLGIILKCQNFMKQVKATGSTNYAAIRPYHVLDYVIPLPSLLQQQELVDCYYSKISKGKSNLKMVLDLKEESEKYFNEVLGIKKSLLKAKNRTFYSTKFSETKRWDVWREKEIGKSVIYSNLCLSNVTIGKPLYGANVKGVNKESDTRYIRITDINDNGTLNDKFVSPESVDDKYLLEEDDFLIARSGNTVGKTFLYNSKYGRAIFAGYLVKYKLNDELIIPKYLSYFTKSEVFKEWINVNKRISGQPNINGNEFLSSPVVVPPLNIQNEIVSTMDGFSQKIERLENEATYLTIQSLEDFEGALFNED